MAERLAGGVVLISVALAFGSTTADAAYCRNVVDHRALQIASCNSARDCIVSEGSGGLPTVPDHPPSAVEARPATVVAATLPVSLAAPPIPALPRAVDAASAPSNGPLAYAILEKQDDHLLSGVRIVMRIQLSRNASESELQNIGEEIICHETVARRLNAIRLLYYLADADTSGLSIAGTAVWAPSGHWDAAHTIRLGDYSRHQHVVSGGNAEGAREDRTGPERPETFR